MARFRGLIGVGLLGGLGCACSSDDDSAAGASGGTGGGGGTHGVIEVGYCGDGDCRLKAGENAHWCPRDCGPPGASGAEVRFFADFSKTPEYGQRVRFTYVVWNAGSAIARNVVLAVPIVLNADTELLGDRWWCGDPGERYDCMVDLGYVPDSMRINRVYHPNRARNSYYFVDTVPLTDEPDDDEGYFNAEQNFLYLTLSQLRSRDGEPEDAGLIWSYELVTDGGIANTPCEQFPLVQNWNYIFADNAEEYTNDIIGHILCASPHFRAAVAADRDPIRPGETIELTVTMSYDDTEPAPGRSIDRFMLLRPRLYVNYPEQLLEIVSIDKPDEAQDLPGRDVPEEGGGVIYWARQNDNGATEMLPGESEELRIQVRVRDGLPPGTEIPIQVVARSQRTLEYQNEDADLVLTVTDGATPSCGDGVCSADEDEASCAQDCPECIPEDGVTSFGQPPCCDGLTMIRGSHPYSWAYDQCYDWEGGGVQFVQAYCTNCGDGSCRGEENECNCPEDCGPHCGNWVCEADEDRASCPADC